MKKISVISLIALCCVLFSACNSGENQTEITQPTTSEHATTEMTTQSITNISTESITQATETTEFNEQETQAQSVEHTEYTEETTALQMTIGNTSVSVDWEDNESVQSLKELCRNQPLTIFVNTNFIILHLRSLKSGRFCLTKDDRKDIIYLENQWVDFYFL